MSQLLQKDDNVNSSNNVNAASTNEVNAVGGKTSIELPDDPNMHALEDIIIFDLSRDNEDVGAEADMNNLDTTIQEEPKKTATTPYGNSSKPQTPMMKRIIIDVHMYRYQVNPKVLHLHDVKRIFKYLKGQPKLGLWYSKDSPFDLVAYTDSDYAGASLDRSLQQEDKVNIDKTQSKATFNESSSPGTSSGSGPRCQETMGDTIAQTRSENVSKHSNDLLLARVLALETTKTTPAMEITSLKRRVKKLEKRNKSRTDGLKRLYKGRIADIDANEDIYLVNVQTDEDMFGVNDLDGDEVIVESVDVVNTAEETRSVVEEVTVVIIPLKSAKPKADKVVIQEPEQGTTTPTLTTTTDATTITAVQDKGKGKMVEPEHVKKMSKKELLRVDEELAFKLQAEEEEERLAREKA
ncbi:hypothetical protein Tco_0485516 [Tanacetum coccineum]